ncbi:MULTISPECIES: DUF2062 domain-containing protein [Marinomonas]|uniref:DUF2062 domain-containing protein n=1 Tax=Marinomonas arctica TaxID=383750 RepID=A0A7H1J114_9GAMM|nr:MULTISPECIES: DUF2062 domain-containing protein [Marinomonas]MCS7487120.1 ATP-binding protein [Marinomonas sp. BSi20414]QNT04180.1 DUF2062 domain-containing protein [Marinomonas arctica]GGN34759.1 hypothetical protein GCM10011350_31400 [Marinomonas arctica]
MPKNYLKKFIPNPEKLKQSKALGLLGAQIYEANLWHLNRKSVARAFFNGLFWAFLPMPFQMLASALLAIPLRANIPLSIALVWITNPLTMPFVFYFNYKLGTFILGAHDKKDFQLSVEWIWDKMEHIWLPLYVGSIVSGVIVGAISYALITILWRLHVVKRWKERAQRNQSQK